MLMSGIIEPMLRPRGARMQSWRARLAQRRHPKARLVVGRQPDPSRIDRGGLAQEMAAGEEIANAAVNECGSSGIGGAAPYVGSMLCIVRKPRIGGSSDIAGGEIGEQRILARPTVAVTAPARNLWRSSRGATSSLKRGKFRPAFLFVPIRSSKPFELQTLFPPSHNISCPGYRPWPALRRLAFH